MLAVAGSGAIAATGTGPNAVGESLPESLLTTISAPVKSALVVIEKVPSACAPVKGVAPEYTKLTFGRVGSSPPGLRSAPNPPTVATGLPVRTGAGDDHPAGWEVPVGNAKSKMVKPSPGFITPLALRFAVYEKVDPIWFPNATAIVLAREADPTPSSATATTLAASRLMYLDITISFRSPMLRQLNCKRGGEHPRPIEL